MTSAKRLVLCVALLGERGIRLQEGQRRSRRTRTGDHRLHAQSLSRQRDHAAGRDPVAGRHPRRRGDAVGEHPGLRFSGARQGAGRRDRRAVSRSRRAAGGDAVPPSDARRLSTGRRRAERDRGRPRLPGGPDGGDRRARRRLPCRRRSGERGRRGAGRRRGGGPVRSAPHRSGRDPRARHGPDVELHRAAVRREVRVRRGRQRRHTDRAHAQHQPRRRRPRRRALHVRQRAPRDPEPAAVPDRAGAGDAVGDRVGAGSGAAARRLQQRARDEFVPPADDAVL